MTKARENSDYTGLAADLAGLQTNITAGDTAARAGRKNLVLNGSMQVAQRNTSTTQHNGYGSDRFEANAGNLDQLAVTLTQNSVTDLPQFTKSLKFTTTTAETNLDSNEYFRIMQKIESQSCQQLAYGTSSANSVTLSFWIKSSVTGTYAFSLFADASAGTRIIGSTYTISSANTWEKKTLTFAGDTVRVMDNNNTEGLRLMWFMGAGSDFTSSDNTSWSAYSASKLAYGQGTNAVLTTANATWEVTGVQLETGSVATDFEHRGIGETLADCQRYYYQVGGSAMAYLCQGDFYTADQFNPSIIFPVTMRAAPAFTQVSGANYFVVYRASNAVYKDNDWTFWKSSPNVASIYGPMDAQSTQGHSGRCLAANGNAKLMFSAEL